MQSVERNTVHQQFAHFVSHFITHLISETQCILWKQTSFINNNCIPSLTLPHMYFWKYIAVCGKEYHSSTIITFRLPLFHTFNFGDSSMQYVMRKGTSFISSYNILSLICHTCNFGDTSILCILWKGISFINSYCISSPTLPHIQFRRQVYTVQENNSLAIVSSTPICHTF